MEHWLVAGELYNQILTAHNNILKSRVKAISDMAHGRLTPDLIDLGQLNKTLGKLEDQLSRKYKSLQLSKITLWDYYSIDNLASTYKNGSFYLSVPVKLEMKL